MANETSIHPFEKAGLGLAPFRCVGMTENWFTVPGFPEATKPGGSCDYCGTGIAYQFQIRSRDGKTFKVGSECVRKTDDPALISEADRLERKAKLDKRHMQEAARIDTAVATLSTPEIRAALSSTPHPVAFRALKGLTRLDWAQWMIDHAGNKGKLEVARYLKQLAAGKLDLDAEQIESTNRMAEVRRLQAEQQDERAWQEAAYKVALADLNKVLVDELAPLAADGNNFAASITGQLDHVLRTDLSEGQKQAIIRMLSQGYRGHERDLRCNELAAILYVADEVYAAMRRSLNIEKG